MADTVSIVKMVTGPGKLVWKFLNKSDGTGESAVVKVNISTLTNSSGVVPTSVIIEKITYDISGMKVQVNAAGTTPVVLANLANFGTMDYCSAAGLNSVNTGTGAGNITFTTSGQTSGATYDITLSMRVNG